MDKDNLDKAEITLSGSMRLYCDNKAAIYIAHNPFQHDWTKHVKIDRHFIKETLREYLICTPFVKTWDQLVDILTKGIDSKPFYHILSKLGVRDIFAPSWGGMLDISLFVIFYYWGTCM